MEKFFNAIRKNKPLVPINTTNGEPWLLAGLGNPGREYRETRHNFGFMVAECLAEKLGCAFTKSQFKTILSIATYNEQKIILVKPQTYMNLSGTAVSSLLSYYKVPHERFLVFHDDLDLPFGTLRMRPGGGSGGQKGLGSIITQLGTQNFARLRLGIGHPPGQMQAPDYVLHKFSPEERTLIPAVLEKAADAALSFVSLGLNEAMTRFNGTLEK